MVGMELDPRNPAPLTRKQKAELAALRPVKRQLTVRIDADVLVWLGSQGAGYHGRLNRILRSAMLKDLGGR